MPFRLEVPGVWVVAACVVLLVGAGCSFAPASRAPEPVAQLPPDFAEAETLATYVPRQWWTTFDDPVLDRLIDTVLVGNLDLAEAVARVEQAAAQARITRSALFPALNGTASASYQDQPANSAFFGGGAGGAQGGVPGGAQGGGTADTTSTAAPERFAIEQYSAAFALSYELDFWGRVRNDTRAAYADAAAAAADLHTARLAVLASTMQAYFNVVDLRRQIVLTLETIDLLAERVALAEQRYGRGLITSFELYALLQDYRNAQAGLPLLEASLTEAQSSLAILTGRYTGRLGALLPDTLRPALPLEPVPPGLPAELLLQRPDVRAAAYRFEAARYRVGARRAELLPSVSLSSQLGLQALEPSGLLDLDNWFASLTGGLTAPLFQGGRLRAGVSAAEAAYAQQAAAYGRTVLTAFGEVETALERYEEERQRYAFLRAQLDEARAQDELQTQRYVQGIGDYTAVLDARRNRLNVLLTLSTATRSVALARLGVHRALGGAWTQTPPTPAVELVDAPVVLPDRVPGGAER